MQGDRTQVPESQSQGATHQQDVVSPAETAELRNEVSEEGQRVQDMLSEGGGVVEPNVPVSDGSEKHESAPASRRAPWTRVLDFFKNLKRRSSEKSGLK